MTDNEKLIEEAAKAIFAEEQCDRHQKRNVDSITENWNSRLVDADKDEYRSFARAALAVFEKAHTPTDDERVARLMSRVTPLGYASALALVGAETRMLAEANEAARRSEVPEPSTAWHDVAAFLESKGLADGGIADFIRENAPEPQSEPSEDDLTKLANDAHHSMVAEAEADGGWYGFSHARDAWQDGFETGYRARAAGGVR